jgi:hypothetical protein
MIMGNRKESTTKEIAGALSIRDQILADEKLAAMASEAGVEARAEFDEEAKPLAPEQVEKVIDGIMTAAYSCFREPELRVLGTNGKRYPVHYEFGGDVDSTGELLIVDKYEFLGTSLARGVCYALENMLIRQDANIAKQKASIRSTILFGHNRGVDVDAQVERMADFLQAMQEQRAFTQIALYRASENLAALTGEGHVTKEQREQIVKARKGEVASSPVADRLAKLGVNLD